MSNRGASGAGAAGSETAKGLWALVIACVIWGLSAIYYKLLSGVPPLEVLAQRTIWSALFFALVLAARGELAGLSRALSGRQLPVIAAAALAISLNWFTFISAVGWGETVAASLGYFILPLVSVAFGVLVFRERIAAREAVAVALAAGAVLWLGFALGATPWISLVLAFSFGAYGAIKKGLDLPPMASVTGEVVLLSPLALLYLAALHFGWGVPEGSGHFGDSPGTALLLMGSGLLTGGPLMLFTYAARRVRLSTVGLVQYLNPTLMFLVAVLVFGEPLLPVEAGAFALIWLALALYTSAAFRKPG